MNIYEVRSEYYRKLKNIKIVGAIAGVVIIMAGIFAYRSLGENNAEEIVPATELDARSMAGNAALLNKRFAYLLQLDENYAVMLGTPGVSMDSADRVIRNEETEFLRVLGKVKKESANLNVLENRRMMDTLVAAFRSGMVNRQFLTGLRNSLKGKNLTTNKNDGQVYLLQMQLQQKNQRIAALEKSANLPAVAKESDVAAETLERSLENEVEKSKELAQVAQTLQQENEQLKTEMNEVRKSSVAKDNQKTRYEQMKEEIEDMNAELNFSQVDCNLVRADVNKIISNAKQRRQMLTAALQTLEALAQSDNPAVKQRAKLKLDELNQIASNVRE